MHKEIVEVVARFTVDGKMTPEQVVWSDGRVFSISRVTDVRRAASLKAGGQGIRYTCRILGRETYLFYDDPIWFVEAKH